MKRSYIDFKLNKEGELEKGVGENLGKATQGSERRSI